MEASGKDPKPRRVDLGFSGGQVLSLRLREDVYGGLRNALEGGTPGWHTIPTQDSEVYVDLSKVVYVSLASQERRAGF